MATKAQLKLNIDTTDMNNAQIETALSSRLHPAQNYTLPQVIRANLSAIRDALAGR